MPDNDSDVSSEEADLSNDASLDHAEKVFTSPCTSTQHGYEQQANEAQRGRIKLPFQRW